MGKKIKRTIFWKKAIIGSTVAVSVGLGFWASQAVYTVDHVIDGDTFVTTENRYVRLDSVNAPELNYCLGKEAKEELEKLVLHKKVYIKTSYVDGHKRLISTVYTVQGNVGEELLKKGLATFKDKGTQGKTNLSKVAKTARTDKVGVYSEKCTQLINKVSPKCDIKGNIKDGNKIYHYRGCGAYSTTFVQLFLGDKWFCSESEAKSAGFVRAPNCH